jgi:hypothetical protein
MVIRPTDRRRESAIAAGRKHSGSTPSPHSRHTAIAALSLGFRKSRPQHDPPQDPQRRWAASLLTALRPRRRLTVALPLGFYVNIPGTVGTLRMLPLYAARIEDLGSGDFVKVDCAACHHVALLTPVGDGFDQVAG